MAVEDITAKIHTSNINNQEDRKEIQSFIKNGDTRYPRFSDEWSRAMKEN